MNQLIHKFLRENRISKITNKVWISGQLSGKFEFDHCSQVSGEKYYSNTIKIKRTSGAIDDVPIIVSEWIANKYRDSIGKKVKIEGEFQSFNKHTDTGRHLKLYVWVTRMQTIEEDEIDKDINLIYLDGYLCKEPIFRETPLGKKITDFFVAVNRPGKSNYIPCISWEKCAYIISEYKVGNRIRFFGRIQSREYFKKYNPDSEEGEWKKTYEISLFSILKTNE